jgi:hypothetical protein
VLSPGLPIWPSTGHIRRLHEGAHNHTGNGGLPEARRPKLRDLGNPCFDIGLRMHEFPG